MLPKSSTPATFDALFLAAVFSYSLWSCFLRAFLRYYSIDPISIWFVLSLKNGDISLFFKDNLLSSCLGTTLMILMLSSSSFLPEIYSNFTFSFFMSSLCSIILLNLASFDRSTTFLSELPGFRFCYDLELFRALNFISSRPICVCRARSFLDCFDSFLWAGASSSISSSYSASSLTSSWDAPDRIFISLTALEAAIIVFATFLSDFAFVFFPFSYTANDPCDYSYNSADPISSKHISNVLSGMWSIILISADLTSTYSNSFSKSVLLRPVGWASTDVLDSPMLRTDE